MYVKGFSPHLLLYFFLAGLMNVRNFFTTLLAITRLLDSWVHYPTLPYTKLKNHYPSGPAHHITYYPTEGIIYSDVSLLKFGLVCTHVCAQLFMLIQAIGSTSFPAPSLPLHRDTCIT